MAYKRRCSGEQGGIHVLRAALLGICCRYADTRPNIAKMMELKNCLKSPPVPALALATATMQQSREAQPNIFIFMRVAIIPNAKAINKNTSGGLSSTFRLLYL